MKGFRKKLLTLILVAMMLIEQAPVTRIYAEGEVSDSEEETIETINQNEEGDLDTGAEFSGIDSEDKDDDDPVDTGSQNDAEPSVEYVENDDVKALSIQGSAAFSVAKAAKAIEENTDLSEEEALELAEELFETRDGETTDPDDSGDDDVEIDPNYPRSKDDTNIENIRVKWITADTVDNGVERLLYIKPEGDEDYSVRLQINYALSGEHDYEPGDVTIKIPASIFKKRADEDDNVEYAGITSIPFPEAPSTKNDFNWNRVGDYYILTNTKHMSAATKGYIQIGFSDLKPHELVDMELSDKFSAYIQVVTHAGNTIALGSNKIRAQFDTEASLSLVTKRAYQSVTRVPATSLPEEQRQQLPEQYRNETEFVKVDWYLWGKINANTLYTIDVKDFIDTQYVGFVIKDSVVVDYGNETDDAENVTGYYATKKIGESYKNGDTSYITFSTAYPISQFTKDQGYTFKNNVTMTVTEVDPEVGDDPQLVTEKTTSATKYWLYRDPEWKEPKGHFNVFKNGNDGKSKNNVTHHVKDSKHRYDSYNDRLLQEDGYYGIYGNALNELSEGRSYEFSYTVNSIGYVMPWTYHMVEEGATPEATVRMIKNWMQRPVKMVTYDEGMHIGRSIEDGHVDPCIEVLEDYEYVSMEFLDPTIYTGVPKNINPDGSWKADTYDDGTFEYSVDTNKKNNPDIKLEVQINGEWIHYATASWKSGSLVVTLSDSASTNGATVNRGVVTFAEADQKRIQNWRTTAIVKNAALKYDVRPVIRVLSNAKIKSLVDAEFAKTDTPVMYFWNNCGMRADEWNNEKIFKDYVPAYLPYEGNENADRWTEIVTFPNEESPYKDGYDRAHGYSTDTAVVPSKTSQQKLSDVNYGDKMVTIHYSAKVEIRSTISDKTTYEQAIADGKLQTTTHGVWRDLLPKGATPIVDTIKLRSKDTVTNVYTVQNYKNTGRTLLVVEADLVPMTATFKEKNSDMTYYEDAPTISFDALYAFDSLTDYGDYIHNVISFESNNEQFGSIENYTGEPDDPTLENHNNITTASAFASDKERGAMKNLNLDHDHNSFVYAGTYTKLDLLSAARTSLNKEVSVNNDGIFTSGVYGGKYDDETGEYVYDHSNERNVYTGGQYTYQIRMMADDETITKDIRLYDSLENYVAVDGNDPIDVPRENNLVYTWKGTFKGYDVSQLIDKGCRPVIYYSWIDELPLSDESDPHAAHDVNTVLGNTNVWLEETEFFARGYTLEDVKAIAIDCSRGVDEDGVECDFELDPLESIVVLIHMDAPSGKDAEMYIKQDAHAYNNAYMLCTTIDIESDESDSDNFVRKDYTKVGLEEYSYDVEKKWIDDNNRDGKRPVKIIVHLLANGIDTGKVLELSEDNDWKGSFEYIPYSDKNGKIHYTVTEETVVGYSPTYKYTSETSCEITNRHTPEKIELSGQKIWVGDEKRVRPDYIIVKLYGNEKLVKQITLQAPEPVEGEDYVDTNVWPYTFTDLYKYENGEEIVYRVEEVIIANSGRSYTTVYDGFTIKNVYHPYGDLYLSKYIQNTTPVSEQVMFEFTFVFTKTTEEGPEPVTASYKYDVLDEDGDIIPGRSGTVATGQTVYIYGNETLHVKEIDEYVKYTITEQNAGGFTITSSKNLEGTISPNQTVQASITNTYSATGSVQLEAVKKLYNKTLKRAKFSFNVYQRRINEAGQEVKDIIKQASNEEVSNVVLREDGTVDYSTADVFFGAIYYTQADAGKTFTYYVEEVAEDKDGYTYSKQVYSVVVTVEDKGDGTLEIEKTYYYDKDPVNTILFENIYKAEGDITLYAWKDLKGRDLKEEEFTFELYDETGKLVETKKNDGNGTVTFTTLHYTEKDIGKTFYYVIHETKGSDNTVIYADDYFAYKIEIQDYENGQLNIIETLVKVEVAVDEEGNLVTYEDGRLKFTFPVEPMKDEQGIIVRDEDGNIVYVNEEGELPVFVNKLEPGSLSITKLIHPDSQEYDPDQEFTFHVKLIGEDIKEGAVYEYEIEKVGSQDNTDSGDPGNGTGNDGDGTDNGDGTGNDNVTDNGDENDTGDGIGSSGDSQPLLANPFSMRLMGNLIKPFHEEGEKDETETYAYAVLVRDNLIFFRSAADYSSYADGQEHEVKDIKNNTYTGIVYANFENDATLEKPYWNNKAGSINKVTFDKDQPIKPVTTSYWFANTKVTNLDLAGLDTSRSTSMRAMFYYCSNLKTVDVSKFNTSNVTSMNSMFHFCLELTGLNLTGFDTSNVTDMTSMFYYCKEIKTLDLSSFNTSNVTSMRAMFLQCQKLENIIWNPAKFTTANVTTMYSMFNKCTALQNISISHFNTENVEEMTAMFGSCENLKTIDVSSFNTSNCNRLDSMFSGCSSVKTLDVSKFNTASCYKFDEMFKNCSSLEQLDLGSFNTTCITPNTTSGPSMYGMFEGCTSLKIVNVRSFETSNVQNLYRMFKDCSSLESLDFRNLKAKPGSAVSIANDMFNGCTSLKYLNISGFSAGVNTNVSNFLSGCNNLSTVVLGPDATPKLIRCLPNPPTSDPYTGKWVYAERTEGYGPWTVSDFATNYNSDMAGKWVWDQSYYMLKFTVADEDQPVVGSMPDMIANVSEDYILPKNQYQKKGYHFENWIEASVETRDTVAYADKGVIPAKTYDNNDVVTLQAVFAKNEVKIKDGEFTITLHGGEVATFDGLPAGTSYQVWEDTPDGWILVEEVNSSGIIIPLQTQDAKFTNMYKPDATAVRFHGTKMLDNTVAEKGKFTFELYEVVNDEEVLIDTVTTLDGGFFQFKRIDYTKDDIGTHKYIIRETGFTDDSIDYDTHEEEVEVFVTEREGKLIARVTYDSDGIKFVNKKRPGLLRLTKVGEGVNDTNKNDQFKFKITFKNEAGMPINDQIYWYIEGDTGTSGSGTETGDSGLAGGGNGSEARRLISNPLSLEFLKTNIGPLKEGDDDDDAGSSTVFHATNDMLQGNPYAIIYSSGSGSNNMLFFRSSETYVDGSTQTVTVNGSQYKDGTVYVINESDSNFSPTWRGSLANVKEVSIAEGVAIKPLTTRGWFSPIDESMGSSSTTGIVKFDLSRLDTSEVTSMQFMFKDCKNLQMLDLSTFDTRKVTSMDGMFANCLKLASLDVSSFRTPVLEIMRWTFHSCQSLVSLDLSSFNTGNVFTFESCFKDMRALKILDIRNFDISKAGNYAGAVNTHSSYHQSYFSSVFESSNAIEYIVLGPNFRFSGGGNTSVLPTPSSQSPYNGTWVRIDRQYGPYTSSQLASNYSSAMAGVWIWNGGDAGSIIYFDANGGYSSTASKRFTSMDSSFTMPDYPDAQKPSYVISGWNTKKDGSGTSYEPGKIYTYNQIGTKIGEVITLYAQWNKGDYWKYTVRHYKEKLDGSGFDLAATEVLYVKPVPSTENPDQLVAVVTPPVKTEYANEGFSLPDPQTVSVKKDGTTFIDYYYSKHRYEIIFDGNGATSGGMENLKMQTGLAKDLPMNTYQKEGAMFTGWNTKADGSGDSFSDGQQVKNLTTEDTITLYAQWLKNDNDPLDPTFGSVTVTLLAGQTIVIPNLPNGTTYEIEEIEVPEGWELKEIEGKKGTIISNHSAQAIATNKYQAKGEAYIVAHKKLVDGEIADGQFSFELRDLKGRVLQTKTNGDVDNNLYLLDENGEVIKDDDGNPVENPYYGYATVVFDPISYDKAGTYNYTVNEVRGDDSNISYDDSSFDVTVAVKDIGKGRLGCEVEYKDKTEPMFVNTYMPGRLKITKEILSGDQNQKFTFVVHLYDEDGKELEGTFEARVVRNVVTEETYYSHTKSVDERGNLADEPINKEGESEHYISVTNASKAVVELKYGNPKEYTYLTINGTYDYGVDVLGNIDTATLTIPREQFVNKPGERGEFIRIATGSKLEWEGYGYFAKITATYVRGGKMAIEKFSSGDTITLTPYDTYEITGIPAGTTYTVEETPIPLNWELVSSENTSGTIVSNQTANVKFTNKYTEVLFADLIIEKELDTWENGSPVTFIFDVVVENNGDIIYADVHSLTYNGPGKKQIVIRELPKGANVTVKEVYAGAGYKITGDATCTLVIDPDKLENKASFTNTYDNKRKRGYGAQNTFTTEDGDTWTWVSDLEEGGEGHE
ncbi:MAG: BspA family leucine-rich repeat surface protein [Erysipelotrichaceae bacterium]|nr:BspA family leucine-rich repeat surface protein [Erysipelotrichaceae bacterium]